MTQRRVPGLGFVSGVASANLPNIEQYNGIPFGSIPARFRQAKLVTSWPDQKWDGTKYGPICPFPRMAIGHPLTQCKLPAQHDYDMDEFKCLNLNITCPKGAKAGDDLPVMVFLHGGGNIVGSGSDPGYNGGPLVNFSVEKKMPVVVVTINYRMGAFGFLASKDIKDDNEAAGDGGCGNYGTRDQLVAFEWVKTNIKAFGGDPNKVTAAGHSAGSIDAHAIIYSELFARQKPFNQAILQSGVAPMTMRSLNHQQEIYEKIAAYVKAPGSGKEKLEALRKLPQDDLVDAYMALGAPIQSWQATVDGYYIKETVRASGLPAVTYDSGLKRIFIGDCTEEGRIAAPNLMPMKWTYGGVLATATKHLGKNAEKVLMAYEITPDIGLKLIPALFKLITDAEWSQPIEAVAKSFSNGDVFYYNMAELNPFDGPNKGTAHHGVDLLFPFLTYQEHLSAPLQKQAEVVAGHWLAFVNGEKPWTPHDGKRDGTSIIMSYGREGSHGEVPDSTKASFKTLRLAEAMQDDIGRFAAALRGEIIIE